ncbi:glucokinase [Algoriphagus alkaliphilus]|uniref:Glucokinase n=1 Tax=Algoriphagus alkaliphilus TaxID=279824 RepID=A0A1G5XH69_9BACT|nr:ROK family protein [Algoriphagus alkaliphilus]SDA69781.1 glucokinase [Algoriphagus alkaliphilus]
MIQIGVDIGGSHISSAQILWNGKSAEITEFHEADIDTFRSTSELIADWSAVIRGSIGSQKDIRIGIAMPGPFDYSNGISLIKDQGKLKSLFGLSVKKLLSESLKIDSKHIVFSNDAEAFLAGESLAGAGRDFQSSIGLTLGTGLGSAIKIRQVVKDGKLWTAPFRDGIAEDYLGTAWFKTYALQKFGLKLAGVKDLLAVDLDREIADCVFAQFGETLGEFLSFYVIRLQCEGVVLGGKITRAADRFLPYTKAYLDKVDYPVEIKISELEEKASLIGACLPFIPEG